MQFEMNFCSKLPQLVGYVFHFILDKWQRQSFSLQYQTSDENKEKYQ